MTRQLDAATRNGFRIWFSEAFINAHIEGGTDLSAIKNRQKRDPTVQGSTLLSVKDASQLQRDFMQLESGKPSPKIVPVVPGRDVRYKYDQQIMLTNYDEDGEAQVVYGTIEFHVYLDPTDNNKRKINHLHSQRGQILNKNQIRGRSK
jgi:hypothetical protein